ncbi:hypothetical protein DDY07_21805 [Methylomonas sp. ZR1]|nr:hypothetical protein [Methylomonas sp. ZR1]
MPPPYGLFRSKAPVLGAAYGKTPPRNLKPFNICEVFVGRISVSVMRRMFEGQHTAQFGCAD